MACGDVLSLEDLQTAKKHQIFEAEVITGKAGGVAGGATIDTATNPVTGQTQQTLPSILADLGFDVQSWTSSTGGVLASANQVFLNDTPGSLGLGDYYAWGGAFPKTVPAGTDPALVGSGYIMRSSRLAGVQAREALRRSYAESGYNLVDGSFEAGGTLVNTNDVLLQERTGTAFSGPAGTVAAGTNPASGGFVDRSVSHRVVYLSRYSTLSDAIGKNLLTRSLKVIVDKDTTETSQVAFSGDLEISGNGVVTMQNGMTALINHSSGSVKISRGVKFRSLDTSSTNSIFAVISTNFTDVDVSATIERVGIKARNVITNVFGKVKFDGVILGDFTAISTPVNDGIIFVEGASELNVDGMTNLSVGAERVIKCSHSVETFSMQYAKMRGSTKRQVVDTYIDTRKVVCRNNDVDMSTFEVFIEGKLKTEPHLPGVSPVQVSVDISRNVFKIGLDQCNRIALFQAPGGTPLEPSNYDSLFVAEDNIIGGRTSSTTFDVRGFTEYKEHGTVYRNENLVVRPAVNVISCNKIDINDILADSYSVNIAGTGSSTGGINYNRSPVDISIGDVTAKYSNKGFVFLNNCDAVDKLAVNECKLVEDTTSPASTGLIYVENSNITSLKCRDNEATFNTSIPLRTSGTVTIGKRVISGNSWQRDSIAFSSQSIANGASVRFAFANINGNYTGGTERFTVSHSEDLKGCTICGYKEGASLYAKIYNYTGASVTIDAGMIYIDIAALQ